MMNQYELVLASASYIRKNQTNEAAKRLKSCKTQQELAEKFQEIMNLQKDQK